MKVYNLLLVLNSVIFFNTYAQKGYTTGDVVINFPIKKILNHTTNSSSFNQINKPLTIIDFFGTWCVPCIKALPHLSSIQKQYQDKVEVVLVSIEEETKLRQFISKQKTFPFPLIVDADNFISTLFQPPSYPYSVILDKQGKILATVTDAISITDQSIQHWLATPMASTTTGASSIPLISIPMSSSTIHPIIKASQELVYAAKTQSPTASIETRLQNILLSTLQETLSSDTDKKAFWINIYNGYTYSILKKEPEKYKKRNRFFSAKQIEIAGLKLSLDDIEHDFLRRNKVKWGLGYLNKWFPSKTTKQLRVNQLDYRIHFALNCGAKSCPPIAYYSPEKLDQQLELATKNYLTNEVEYDSAANVVRLPAIMSWFRGDFGGKKGMISILKEQGIIPLNVHPRIKFKPYDWTLELNNYKTENE